jgi:hypothetical protein
VTIERIGSGKFDQENLLGHGLGSDRFGPGRNGFQVQTLSGFFEFRVISGRAGSGSYELISFWVSDHLILSSLGFQIVLNRAGPGWILSR